MTDYKRSVSCFDYSYTSSFAIAVTSRNLGRKVGIVLTLTLEF